MWLSAGTGSPDALRKASECNFPSHLSRISFSHRPAQQLLSFLGIVQAREMMMGTHGPRVYEKALWQSVRAREKETKLLTVKRENKRHAVHCDSREPRTPSSDWLRPQPQTSNIRLAKNGNSFSCCRGCEAALIQRVQYTQSWYLLSQGPVSTHCGLSLVKVDLNKKKSPTFPWSLDCFNLTHTYNTPFCQSVHMFFQHPPHATK